MRRGNELAVAVGALLSSPVLRSVMNDEEPGLARAAIDRLVDLGFADDLTTVRKLVWRCDRWLARNYRNDAVYRKAVLSDLIPIGRATLLPEFRANRSIVDLLSVTSGLHAVEIKSDLDTIARVESQLIDFGTIASRVSLVGPLRVVERLYLSQARSVGLYWLDLDGRIQVLRPASHSTERLDSGSMMRSLRRAEYVEVSSRLGSPPSEGLPNTRIFAHSLDVAKSTDPVVYQDQMARILERRRLRAGNALMLKAPAPIRAALLKLDPSRLDYERLFEWLNMEVNDVHA